MIATAYPSVCPPNECKKASESRKNHQPNKWNENNQQSS